MWWWRHVCTDSRGGVRTGGSSTRRRVDPDFRGSGVLTPESPNAGNCMHQSVFAAVQLFRTLKPMCGCSLCIADQFAPSYLGKRDGDRSHSTFPKNLKELICTTNIELRSVIVVPILQRSSVLPCRTEPEPATKIFMFRKTLNMRIAILQPYI